MAARVPLPNPEGVTEHQDAALLASQAELEVTVKLVVPTGAVTFWLDGLTLNEAPAPACVTVTITGLMPITVTVILATRQLVEVFSVNVAVMVPFPLPEGVIVHHVASLTEVQAEFEVTVKLVLPAAAVTSWLGGVTASVGGAPNCVRVTVTGVKPVTVIVIEATRWLRLVFSV